MCVFKYHAFIYFLRPPPWYGTLTMRQVFLDWENISSSAFEMEHFLILSIFFLHWGFVSKKLKTGPSETWNFGSWNWSYWVQKIEDFLLISQMYLLLQSFIRFYQINSLQLKLWHSCMNIYSVSLIQNSYGVRLYFVVIRRVTIFFKMVVRTVLVRDATGIFVAGKA